MRPLRQLHIGLVLLALVNMVPVAVPGVEGESAWGIMILAAGAAILSCLIRSITARRWPPVWVLYILVMGTMLHLVYEMFGPHAEQTVYLLDLAHFMMLLCSCKFLELRGPRDMGVVVLISFLLLVIAAFVSASVLFGLVVGFNLTFGIGWLLAFQARRDRERITRRSASVLASAERLAPPKDAECPQLNLWHGRPACGSTGETPVPQNLRAARRNERLVVQGFYRHHARTTASAALALVALGAAGFVTIPRGWGSGLLGGFRRAIPTSVAGVADEIHLDNRPILEDTAPVMRVQFMQNSVVLGGDDFQPYLRGQSFDRYHTGRWRRTPPVAQGVFLAGTPEAPQALSTALEHLPAETLVEQRIWLEGLGSSLLFSAYPPLTFGSTDVKAVQQDRRDLALLADEPFSHAVQYVVHSAPVMPAALARGLELRPEKPRDGPSYISRRVRDLALSFPEGPLDLADPQQVERVARLVCDYLGSREFEYTLQRGEIPAGPDPIDDFLFINKRGHCEYFASAMTMLCQALGIRARLVSGFSGGEFNTVGGFYLFRQKDAHAWVEVYLPGVGWRTFDPTPGRGSRTRGAVGLFARAERLYDFLQFKWATLVISFDADSRADMVSRLKSWLSTVGNRFGAGGWKPRAMLRTMTDLCWGPEFLPPAQRLFYWMYLILCAVLVVVVLRVLWIIMLILRAYSFTRSRSAKRAFRRAEAKFYDRLLLLLARKGYGKPPSLTPREFAHDLAQAHVDFADLPAFTEWFYEIQYGQRPMDKPRWERLNAYLRRLRGDASFGVRRDRPTRA